MFHSEGLTTHGKFFAFIGRDGQLILKLPEQEAAALIADGHAAAGATHHARMDRHRHRLTGDVIL